MWPLSVPHLKMATRANQLAEPVLRMEMAVGQDRQNGGRCNTSHQGWSFRMVRSASPGVICSLMSPAVVTKGIISEHEARQLFQM